MTSAKLIYGLAGAAAFLGGSACAQTSVQTQGSITVLDPAQISRDADLAIPDVALPSAGSRTATGQVASYSVTGQGGESFNISVPPSLTLVRSGGTEQIELSLTPSLTQGAYAGLPGTVSSARVGIAGSVPVSSTAAPGSYRGKYTVTLAYQ